MKKLKVLIVDDSSVMRKIVERALRQAGLELAEVLEASNGAEALTQVQKGGLDMILSDINMPVMDGLEFLKSLAGVEAAKGVPVATVLRYLRYYEAYGKRQEARALYQALPPASRALAEADLDGAEAACPYGLPVAELIRTADRRLS